MININNSNLHEFKNLKQKEWITYTGSLLCMRDTAHKKLVDNFKTSGKLDFELENKIIFYAGPAQSKKIIVGPTTSKRMDAFLEFTLQHGVIATIGKGERSNFVHALLQKYKAPYLIMPSGVAAYLSQFFISEKIIAYTELGPEAVREYKVKEVPLFTSLI